MAIDVKTISCPQCGSTDVEMVSDNKGKCRYCGAQFSVQQRIDAQNVYNEIHVHEGNDESITSKKEVNKATIIPEYSKDKFIRKIWIEIAKDDAPFDIFDQNFGDVVQNEHQVLIQSLSADMNYQASIGYDRQEPYIAYEDYYEDESYYENGQRKTRSVRKQRPVTKYKTVTDWSAQHGTHHASSIVTVENIPNQFLDEELFISSFRYMKEKSLSIIPEDVASKIEVTKKALEAAAEEHHDILFRDLYCSLPGDRKKDIDYQITKITDSSMSIYVAQEYEATISYNGKTYTKRAFPFGKMEIGGDKVENEEGLETVTEGKRARIPDMVWPKVKNISILTIILLALTIIVNCFIHVTALVVICFIAAVAAFVVNTVMVRKQTKDITAMVETEISDYSTNYKTKQRELLNNKLKSLGLEPAKADEL